jgi:PAS domain S-box-containing protein
MPDNEGQENIDFDGGEKHEKADVKRILQPRLAIVNSYTLIATVYCIASSILFFSLANNYFLAVVHLLALLSVVINYIVLLRTKNFKRATNVILSTGTVVVVSLFATGGWENTGYLWPFAYLPYAFFLSERHAIIHWIVALFSGCILALLLHLTGAITIPYSPVAIVNFFAALIIFTLCIMLFLKATVKREDFLTYTGALLEAAPDAVIVIDEQGQIIKWNDKAEILFGWKENEIIGKLLSSVIIPLRYREAHKKGMQRFLETGQAVVLNKTVELKALNKANKEFDVALSIAPVVVKEKYQFIGFVRDITEQKRTEEKFRSLLESAPDAMVIVDKQGRINLINVQTETLFGYTREELIGREVEILIPGRFVGNHSHHRENFFANPKVRSMGVGLELFGKKKDGTEFPVEISLSPLNIDNNMLVSAAIRDVTERKQAEQKIRENEQMFSSLFYKSPIMKAIADADSGKYIDVNDSFADFMGYRKEEILGKTSLDLNLMVLPGERKKIFSDIQSKGYVREVETEINPSNGNARWVSTNIDRVNLNGRDCLITAAIDITEKKKLEQKLMEANVDLETKIYQRTEQLERQNAELEQFAYIASHDLQEPLRMVASFMQLLKSRYKDKLDADGQEFIHFAVDGATRMKQLISDLLNYSRTGREAQITDVDIANVLGEVQKNLMASINESKAVIHYGSLPVIKADRTQMLQLFQNLISNAIKFRKDSDVPSVQIDAKQENGHWLFSVKDNGIGIEREYSNKVFVIFRQLHDKAKYGGTGIGLAIAKKIVERHRGKIWFESELGKGTTFYFTLKNT